MQPLGSVVRFFRGIVTIAILLVLLGTFSLPAIAQGNKPPTSQTVIADYSNNGLNTPNALAVAADGSVFIVDSGNNRVLKIASQQTANRQSGGPAGNMRRRRPY